MLIIIIYLSGKVWEWRTPHSFTLQLPSFKLHCSFFFLTTNNYFQRDIFWQNFSIMDSWERVTNLKQKAFFLAPIRWRDHGNIKWALLAILLLPLKTVSLSPLTHSNSKRRRQIISRANIQMSHAFQSLNFGTCAFLI